MTFDPVRHHRRSLRLQGYDYAQAGGYFVTVCAAERRCVFGEVVGGAMSVNDVGRLVESAWNDLPAHYPHVELDAFVIMPNHIHGIIILVDRVGAGFKPAPTPPRHGLPEIVRAFKTFSSRRIDESRGGAGRRVWQRGYYEHIVRDEDELNRIREYIAHNPLRWQFDQENPECRNGLN